MTVPAGVRPQTVSRLTSGIKSRVEEHFGGVWVIGQVSDCKLAASGHWYFSLSDASAVLKCAMFRPSASRLQFRPSDGMSVVARGNVSVYEPRGEYQLIVDELHEVGVGTAELALRRLKDKLFHQGYFDHSRKRSLSRYPRCIALIASPTGAAIRDMLELLAQRWPLTRVVVRPSRVQGEGAAAEIAAHIRLLSRLHQNRQLPLDAIVLGRGGGSSEDLGAFNEEIVADAIFESRVAVVSAIGHETDLTVADLVADFRAETPSAAIAALTPDRRKALADLAGVRTRLQSAIAGKLRFARARLDQYAHRPAFRKPLDRIRLLEAHLERTGKRLHRSAAMALRQARERLAARAERLESLSPLQVLYRGYSLTRRGDGTLLRAASDTVVGEVLITKVAKGEVWSRVIDRQSDSGLCPSVEPTCQEINQ